MRSQIVMTAGDGHAFVAWRSDPAGTKKGAVVVLHAVYGLTPAIAQVCERWAAAGYAAVAPALFDRLERGVVHPYSAEGARQGAARYAALPRAGVFADIEACRQALACAGPVAICGFCTGGDWAWDAAIALDFAAQVNFYGSHLNERLDSSQRCPSILHYGDRDHVMSRADIGRITAAHPRVETHIYPGAGHAFMNPDQATFDPVASALAWERSIGFLDRVTGAGEA